MKKFNILLLWVLACVMPLAVNAAPVKVEKAKSVAADFFAKANPTRAAISLELVWNGQSAATRSTEEPLFYVFNRTNAPGFVMVAGDDATAPILGYSFEHAFGNPDQMPAHMQWWFGLYADMIRAVRESGQQPDEGWTTIDPLATPVRVHETALWDQGTPYNKECPVYTGTRVASTGCVQTAGAIVMKYHRWPEELSGTVPGYTTETRRIQRPARELRPYNWDLMPNEYKNYSAEQGAEVARLMADLGTADKADYGVDEGGSTGAFDTFLLNTLATYMGFNKQMRLASRDGMNDEQWTTILREELDANGPVIYSGTGKTGGHCFVLDGYDSNGTFRFNWGWSGSGNGYYTVKNLKPDSYDFTQGQTIIRGIYPDKTGTTVRADDVQTINYNDINGFEISKSTVITGETFTADLCCVNRSTRQYSGKIGVAVFSQSGELKEVLYEKQMSIRGTTDEGSMYIGILEDISCKVTGRIARGDRLSPIFWDNGLQKYQKMGSYNAVCEILISPEALNAATIAEGTSLAWDRTTRKLTLNSYADLTYKLAKADGTTVASGTMTGQAVVVKDVAAGSYTLSVTDPEAETNGTYTVRLTF